MVAQKHPEWVSGAAPLCGVLGGPVANVNLSLDVAYALKTFVNPDLKLSGFTSWDDAVRELGDDRRPAREGRRATWPTGCRRSCMTAALVDAPSQTRTYDGSTIESQVRGYGEAVLTALGYATFGRYDIEQRVGATLRTTARTDYATSRLRGRARAHRDGLARRHRRRCWPSWRPGERLTADPPRRQALRRDRDSHRAVQDPTITMHTAADPLVIVQNENLFQQRYSRLGRARRT